jgi:hypothetical protein
MALLVGIGGAGTYMQIQAAEQNLDKGEQSMAGAVALADAQSALWS